MKTIKLLREISSEYPSGLVVNVSDRTFETLKGIGFELEELPDSDKSKILSADMIDITHLRSLIKNKPLIQLVQSEMDTTFVQRLAEEIKKININLFFEGATERFVEIKEWEDKHKNRLIFGKKFVEPMRLKAILEEKFVFYIMVKEDEELKQVIKSPSKVLLDFAMNSVFLRNAVKQISGVYESPFIFVKDGKLLTTERGYNESCGVYVKSDAPELKLLDVEHAKEIIQSCFLDFPFQSEQDRVFAIAALITPMLRGLYGQYGTRTPVFAYLANQQGCGKDYCAGIRHIVYLGRYDEDAPISSDKGSNSEEFTKEIVSAGLTGRQFMHNSNCRGHFANASYEKTVTSSAISGRELGKNNMITLENTVEFSFSGNYGLTFNRDIARRAIFVNLFTDVEDTTKRVFTKDLHQWILENRSLCLSAIYTLIKTWWDNGHKDGTGINASYPLWAKYCSGVMQYHNLGNPCESGAMVINDIGGDYETKDICQFNTDLGEWLDDVTNCVHDIYNEHKLKGITKKQIFQLYEKLYVDTDDRPFSRFDLQTNKDRREMGRTLNKYIGTYRGGYKIIVSENNQKLDRIKYKFEKLKVVPTVPTGLVKLSPHMSEKNQNNYIEYKIDPVNPVRTLNSNEIVSNPTEYEKVNGLVFESEPNVWRRVA